MPQLLDQLQSIAMLDYGNKYQSTEVSARVCCFLPDCVQDVLPINRVLKIEPQWEIAFETQPMPHDLHER